MSLLSKLFRKAKVNDEPPVQDEQLVPVPIPALTALLLNLEKSKGSSLSQGEVIEIRNNAVCMMLPLSVKLQMDSSRGYEDINPENVWQEWLLFKESVEPVIQPQAQKYTDRIQAHCELADIEIPPGFYRHPASRYAVIYQETPPKLVAKTWNKQEDVVYYLQKYAGGKSVKILDFKDRQELSFEEGKTLKRGASF